MNPRVNAALRAFAETETSDFRLCKCGSAVDSIGTLCLTCIEKEPELPASVLMAVLAVAIREQTKTLEKAVEFTNYAAAGLASLRRAFDAVAVTAHREASEERTRREKAPESDRVPKTTGDHPQ